MVISAKPNTYNGDLSKPPPALAPLASESRWANWQWVQKLNGDWQKPPIRARNPHQKASSTDPKTWGTYQEALIAKQSNRIVDGISLMLNTTTALIQIAIIDLDHCRDERGNIDAWAATILEMVEDSFYGPHYYEISASGTGFHIIGTATGPRLHCKINLEGEVAGARKGAAIEIWRSTNMPVVTTFNQVGDTEELGQLDRLIDHLCSRYNRDGNGHHTAEPEEATEEAIETNTGNGTAGDHAGTRSHAADLSDADYQACIETGAPLDATKTASEWFHCCVLHLAKRGHSFEQVVALFDRYPEGIAARYIKEKRLSVEVGRCLGKRAEWQKANPQFNGAAQEKTTGSRSRKAADDLPPCLGLEIIRADQVEMANIDFLWLYRLARGEQTSIAGEGGLGKSQVTLFIAAALTTGGNWPCKEGSAPRAGSVVILSAEDNANTVLVPRLKAAGADISKIHIIKAAYIEQGGKRKFNLQADLAKLEAAIKDIGDVEGVIIDPVSSYLGGALDSHQNTKLRDALDPITEMAERAKVAVISVTHFNKGVGLKAIHRVMGGSAFVNAPRINFAVVEDPENEGRCLLLHLKNNIGPKPQGLAFRTSMTPVGTDAKGIEIRASRVVWEHEPISKSVDEVMSIRAECQSALGQAKAFLHTRLATGPVPQKEIEDEAKANMISHATLRRAKEALGVVSDKPPDQ